MKDYNKTLLIDNKLKKNIESLFTYKNGCCSVKFKDIDGIELHLKDGSSVKIGI